MAYDEFSREEIPSDGVSIGGDDDCEHATYRRFGSDGGGNIYFRCTNCSNVILNYDTTETNSGQAPKLSTGSDSGPTHDPLVKGLTIDSENSDTAQHSPGFQGFLSRVKSDLKRLLPFRTDE